MANSKASTKLSLTRKQIYLALGKTVPGPDGKLIANPNKKWSDVDPSLPNKKIEVLGPRQHPGLDAFAELALEGGCKTFSFIKAMKKKDKNATRQYVVLYVRMERMLKPARMMS